MITFNSIAERPKPIIGRIFGGVLCGLGLYVMLGWVLNNPAMVQFSTDDYTMRFNTALCFLLIGLLFLIQGLPVSRFRRRAHNLLTLFLLSLLVLVLAEYITGRNLSIDMQNMHLSVPDGNPHPGRMSVMTTLSMLFLGIAFVGLPRANKQLHVVALTILPGIAVFIIAVCSLFYDLFDMNDIFRFGQYNTMSPPAAVGLIIASIGLAFLGLTTTSEFALSKSHYDKQITRVAAAVMLIVTLVVGLSCLIVLKKSADLGVRAELQQLASSTSGRFEETFVERFNASNYLAAAPSLMDRMKKIIAKPKDVAARAELSDWTATLLNRGYSAVTVYDNDGSVLASHGPFTTSPWRSFTASVKGQTGEWMWQDGFILKFRRDIIIDGVKQGSIETEQHLTALTAFFEKMHQLGDTIDTVFCGRSPEDTMICAPSRLIAEPPVLSVWPKDRPAVSMSHALSGETGILYFRDLRNHFVLAAYTPIAGSNMGIVVKMDTAELYTPIRNYIQILIAIIALLAMLGTFIMRSQVKPLTKQLVKSEQKMQEANQFLLRDAKRLNQVINAQEQMAQTRFNLDEVLNQIVHSAMDLTNATGAAVELLDQDELVYRAASGLLRNYVNMRLKAANSLSGICIASGEIISCEDTENDTRVNQVATRKLGIRSMIVAPLMNEGRTIGVIKVSAGTPGAFQGGEKETLHLISGLIANAISRQLDADIKQKLLEERSVAIESLQQAQHKLSYMAQYDQLTGLPNRALFLDRMHMAIQRNLRNHKAMALMFLDLDGFKEVNDRLGHQMGDKVLKMFAERLSGAVRMTDAVARLGGDEFTIILEEISNPDIDVQDIATKIINVMQEPFTIDGHSLPLTTSIGICIHRLGPAKPDELIHLADTEMYKAKKAGKNAFSISIL